METLEIMQNALRRLEDEKYDLQSSIGAYFKYDKFPSDEDFEVIFDICDNLKKNKGKIENVEELLEYLESQGQ